MDARVREVLDLLAREWRARHRVGELAARVNLGESRLAHLMRGEADTCIRDVVRRRRLDEAARLLATTHGRVSEISYDVGFADLANFCHAFRRHFGVSPTAYRRRIRQLAAASR
jgi:AraC family transcriptional regulator of arabinose operon